MSMRKNILLALGCMIGLGAGASYGVVKTVTLQQGVNGYTGSKGAGFWDPSSVRPANPLVANVSKDYYYLDDGG